MASTSRVTIHGSQFPDRIARDLVDSLARRQINHKFHYDSIKQTQKWLALHKALSPAQTDPDCAGVYDRAFEATAGRITRKRVHLIGLGCGGGQKDTRLLELLREPGRELWYTPLDVSVAMVLVAQKAAAQILPASHSSPLVCDLAAADDLPAFLEGPAVAGAARLHTFFGMIPNFEPQSILPQLASVIRSSDWLLFSANLAPGHDYAAGVRKILPLYDNALTRDWLLTFLLDLGFEKTDGQLAFRIEDDESFGLKRIAAHFLFSFPRSIRVHEREFEFHPGDSLGLFFSYRYTPRLIQKLLADHGLQVVEEWITRSGEEGVFLCRRG